MRARTYGIAALALLGACSPGAAWTDYTYKPQHFAAAFTAPPRVADHRTLLVEQNDGDVDFGVTAACDLVTDKSPDQVMADAVDATRRNGTLHGLTYAAVGGVTGRDMLVDRSGGSTVRQRIVVRGGCLYLVFATTKGGADDERVVHFLDSFRFI